ncbi:MAG: pilus assembly protein PilP [Deltaproteobacteria bacterium]|nr:pilus assembly protein PilP [Deltaproteobacteria bacterium]
MRGAAAVIVLILAVVPMAAAQAVAPTPPAETEIAPRPVVGAPPYDPTGKRDPFRPFIIDVREASPNEPLTPLQRYDVGQLLVVAVLWEVSPPRAMVEDSIGMGYIVTVGTPIGRRSGVVKAIEPSRVVVEERVIDFYGQEQTAEVVMELPGDKGTKQKARERE